jgi:hypothetical protein
MTIMNAGKNYSVRSLKKIDEPAILELMARFPHLPEKKARRVAREMLALRKFSERIVNAAWEGKL